jgi:hypothetical protein
MTNNTGQMALFNVDINKQQGKIKIIKYFRFSSKYKWRINDSFGCMKFRRVGTDSVI